jgi:hypothetical protein
MFWELQQVSKLGAGRTGFSRWPGTAGRILGESGLGGDSGAKTPAKSRVFRVNYGT